MKKKTTLILSALLLTAGATAQETTPTTETVVVVEEERPDMPIIFFSKEQRRILEAVRQGVVAADTFEAEGFIPLVVIEETLPEENLVIQQRVDRQAFSIDALVRNRTRGTEYVWVNGDIVEISKDSAFLNESGLSVDEGVDFVGNDNVIRGIDEYEQSKFEVKVGQVFTGDGYVNESLPVVVHHKKK